MSTVASPLQQRPFQHRALLYADDDQFLDGTVPFLRAGMEAGDVMLVAVGPDKTGLLRGELGADAGAISFADMRELGSNPARIIPAWQDLVDARAGRGVRGIGEPIWAGRTPEELAESQRHEMLLNVAFARTPAFELVCPYDVARLPDAVVEEAHHSHPPLGDERPWECGWDAFDGRLEPVPDDASDLWFRHDGLGAVRELVRRQAAAAGLGDARTGDLAVSVTELATNSIRHGGGGGLLRAWTEGGAVRCQVDDAGRIRDQLLGRRRPDVTKAGGFGLWIVHQLCDLVQVRSASSGSLVRLTMRVG